MRSFLLALSTLVSVCACSPYGQLSPGDAPPRQAGDGWLALGMTSPSVIAVADLCLKGAEPCYGVGPFDTERDLQLVMVPQGTWCLTRIVFVEGGVPTIWNGAYMCERVEAGRVTYRGHHTFEITPGQMGSSRIRNHLVDRWREVRARLAREFPAVSLPGAASAVGR